MEGRKIEQLMHDFIEGKFDVLVSTTIIENGVHTKCKHNHNK